MNIRRQILCCLIFYFVTLNAVFSQSQPKYYFTIDSNRIIHVNGQPFFPIGECYEMESQDKYKEMSDAGFNYINLFTENHKLNSYFHSYNIISGDRSSGPQYNKILNYWNFDYMGNANRIFNLSGNNNLFVISDDFFDWSDDLTVMHLNAPPFDDNITLNPPFNQTIRNQSINRLNQLAALDNSRLMGGFAFDEVNLFQVEPNPPM